MRPFSIIPIQLTFSSPGNIIVLSYDYNEHSSLDSQVLYFSFLYFPLNYSN